VPTASSSPTTGALTVAGGVGVAGALQVGGDAIIRNQAQFTDGATYTALLGPTGVGGQFSFGGTGGTTSIVLKTSGTEVAKLSAAGTATTSPATGALTVAGGVGINGSLWTAGAHVSVSGAYYFVDTKSLTYSAGNFIFNGGPLNVTPGGQLTSAGSAAFRIGFTGGGTQYGITLRPQIDGTPNLLFVHSGDVAVGQISTNTTATSYITSSDERLKEDLKSFDAGNIVDNTNVYDFAWKSTGERSYGVVAQQAQTVYPTAVTYTKELDFWGVDYSKYVPVLLQELKALRERVRDLEGKVGVGVQPA
jgi:hypothetical protein